MKEKGVLGRGERGTNGMQVSERQEREEGRGVKGKWEPGAGREGEGWFYDLPGSHVCIAQHMAGMRSRPLMQLASNKPSASSLLFSKDYIDSDAPCPPCV